MAGALAGWGGLWRAARGRYGCGTIALALAGAAPVAGPRAIVAPVVVRPALWVVRDADTTVYLFGTIHLLKPGTPVLAGAVARAFGSAGELVLEVPPPEPGAMAALVARTASDGTALSARLPAATRAALARALAATGLAPDALDRYEPWFAVLTLSVAEYARLGFGPDDGAEAVLARAAVAARKPVTGIETADEQIALFDRLPMAEQVRLLEVTLAEQGEAPARVGALVAAWSAGDPERVAREMNAGFDGEPALRRALLTTRNVRFARWVRARLARPGVVFVGVGAGHLAGADSVQVQLGRMGARVLRVDRAGGKAVRSVGA